MLVGQRKKSQKYIDPSTFNYNLYDSNPCSSLGVMNFQKWELFSGSPGTLKGLFHPACLARVVSWIAFVVATFMGLENGDKLRPTKR